MTSPEQEPDDTLTAACVQWDVRRGDVAANLTTVTDGLRQAAAAGASLAVLPELWSTSFLADFPAATLAAAQAAEAEVLALSGSLGLVIIGSSIEAADGRMHNTARVYDRGQQIGAYRKIHLFSPIAEDRYFCAGDDALVVDTSIGRIGVLICYDLRFPELARHYFHRNAQILVVPGQWPEARSVHWRALLRARAIENEMYVVGCNRLGQELSLKNNTDALVFPGDSRIIDPTGEILASGSGEQGVITAELEVRKARTIRRILPVARDQRPEVYRKLWDAAWPDMARAARSLRKR